MDVLTKLMELIHSCLWCEAHSNQWYPHTAPWHHFKLSCSIIGESHQWRFGVKKPFVMFLPCSTLLELSSSYDRYIGGGARSAALGSALSSNTLSYVRLYPFMYSSRSDSGMWHSPRSYTLLQICAPMSVVFLSTLYHLTLAKVIVSRSTHIHSNLERSHETNHVTGMSQVLQT